MLGGEKLGKQSCEYQRSLTFPFRLTEWVQKHFDPWHDITRGSPKDVVWPSIKGGINHQDQHDEFLGDPALKF